MAAIAGILSNTIFERRTHSFNKYGPVPNRMRLRIVLVLFDHLARHWHHVGHGKEIQEVVIRRFQADLQRVRVNELQASMGVSKSYLPAFSISRCVRQSNYLVLEQPLVGRAIGRVAEAADGIFEVLCNQLAALCF